MRGSRQQSWILVALICGACGSKSDSGGGTPAGATASGGAPGIVASGGASVIPTASGGAAGPVASGGATQPMGTPASGGAGVVVAPTGGTSPGGPGAGGQAVAGGGTTAGGGAPGFAGGTTPGLTDPGTDGDGDFQITAYPTDPDLTPGKSPAGKRFNFNQTGSKLYPATQSRAISVYIPAKYKDGTPAPVMVVMDGAGSQFLRVQAGLDNLSQTTDPTRKIPAFVEIAVANGERSIELDTMSDLWARYVDEEVFPAVESNAAIKAAYPNFSITKDPEGRGAIGCSSGGSAAIIMAWFRPDLFRRVIGYDASLVDLQSSAMYPLGAWDLHSDLALILNSPVEPIRIMFDDNEMDNGAGTGEAGAKDWLLAGQRTAAALKTKGYHYRWLEGMGAKHCSDARVQQTSMGDSLVWVWRGFPSGP
jgi:iron(III)-enterobactin esterase